MSQVQIAPTRLHHGADHLFGRDDELTALDQVWNDPTKKVLTIVAFGGVGKTSLVIEWMARQASKNWESFERVFDWSFFSQGVREKGGASAETFIAAALRFFGDVDMAESAASAWDKGARLARLVAERRTLLVLDGVEPLQHPPGPLAGEIKDPALATLLKGLARSNAGLCIVTTREHVADLGSFLDTTSPEWQLHHLYTPAAVELLKTLGVRGKESEFQELVDEVKGHALTLNLVGRYLVKAHNGDIRKRDQVKFEKADEKIQGGYAFKTIGAYEKWLAEGGEEGSRALAVLQLLGLFDRPADVGCLTALCSEPAIEGLTEPLIGLDEEDWNLTVSSLADCGLVFVQSDESEVGSSQSAIDAHPLLREYFAKHLCENSLDAWRAAHRRLYEYLIETTKEGDQPSIEDLQPLYQAVAHGCKAGMEQKALNSVYVARIMRGQEYYSSKKLGAIGYDLGAITCFFESPWSRVSDAISRTEQSWLLHQSAFRLSTLGRQTEAIEPLRAGLKMHIEQKFWIGAAISASNLSELDLTLGEVARAVQDAEQSVTYADRSGDAFQKLSKRARLADSLHQAGRRSDARARFSEAENLQAENQPDYPLLYAWQGFAYCELLMAEAERGAWQATLVFGDLSSLFGPNNSLPGASRQASLLESGSTSTQFKALSIVSQRAAQTLQWLTQAQDTSLLAMAINYLAHGRAAFYEVILEGTTLHSCHASLQHAVVGIRRSGNMDDLPRCLLTRAWLRSLSGRRTGPESAQADMEEAWEIAERGPMRLHMADIHLYRARLFHAVKPYPWKSPHEDLAAARKLIEQCGYWRRKEELEDAEDAAKNW